MGKKMYYTEEEAAEKLGASLEQLDGYVRDEKLRRYQDGDRKMFKAEDVDSLAGAGGAEEEIKLTPADPADTAAAEDADRAEADRPKTGGKGDTVITADGISIFDAEDLEVEPVDPLAKTQLTAGLEDQISLEGAGGGSGLLDLTREGDDTSLGAEVLDHIDMDGIGSSIGAEVVTEPEPYAPQAVAEQPIMLEAMDASTGLFSGMILGCSILAMLLGAVMLAVMTEIVPGYLEGLKNNMIIALPVLVVLVGLCGLGGFLFGKSAVARQEAMRPPDA